MASYSFQTLPTVKLFTLLITSNLSFCSLTWTKRPISRTSSTASSSTSSCQSRRSTKRWTRRRECHISSHYTSLTRLSSLAHGAKQLRTVNIFAIQSELLQLRLTPEPAVTSLWVHVSLICLTCLTCVPVNPFSVWHICWRASKLNQQIPNRHTQLEKIHLIYLSIAARQQQSAVGHGLHFSELQPCTPGLSDSLLWQHITVTLVFRGAQNNCIISPHSMPWGVNALTPLLSPKVNLSSLTVLSRGKKK